MKTDTALWEREGDEMSRQKDEDQYYLDTCYECTGYGDDYYFDPDTGGLELSCDTCPVFQYFQLNDGEVE